MPNPFIIPGRAIDKTEIMQALAEGQRVLNEAQLITEKAIRNGDFDTEVQWATMMSNAEITLSNIADMLRKRFV